MSRTNTNRETNRDIYNPVTAPFTPESPTSFPVIPEETSGAGFWEGFGDFFKPLANFAIGQIEGLPTSEAQRQVTGKEEVVPYPETEFTVPEAIKASVLHYDPFSRYIYQNFTSPTRGVATNKPGSAHDFYYNMRPLLKQEGKARELDRWLRDNKDASVQDLLLRIEEQDIAADVERTGKEWGWGVSMLFEALAYAGNPATALGGAWLVRAAGKAKGLAGKSFYATGGVAGVEAINEGLMMVVSDQARPEAAANVLGSSLFSGGLFLGGHALGAIVKRHQANNVLRKAAIVDTVTRAHVAAAQNRSANQQMIITSEGIYNTRMVPEGDSSPIMWEHNGEGFVDQTLPVDSVGTRVDAPEIDLTSTPSGPAPKIAGPRVMGESSFITTVNTGDRRPNIIPDSGSPMPPRRIRTSDVTPRVVTERAASKPVLMVPGRVEGLTQGSLETLILAKTSATQHVHQTKDGFLIIGDSQIDVGRDGLSLIDMRAAQGAVLARDIRQSFTVYAETMRAEKSAHPDMAGIITQIAPDNPNAHLVADFVATKAGYKVATGKKVSKAALKRDLKALKEHYGLTWKQIDELVESVENSVDFLVDSQVAGSPVAEGILEASENSFVLREGMSYGSTVDGFNYGTPDQLPVNTPKEVKQILGKAKKITTDESFEEILDQAEEVDDIVAEKLAESLSDPAKTSVSRTVREAEDLGNSVPEEAVDAEQALKKKEKSYGEKNLEKMSPKDQALLRDMQRSMDEMADEASEEGDYFVTSSDTESWEAPPDVTGERLDNIMDPKKMAKFREISKGHAKFYDRVMAMHEDGTFDLEDVQALLGIFEGTNGKFLARLDLRSTRFAKRPDGTVSIGRYLPSTGTVLIEKGSVKTKSNKARIMTHEIGHGAWYEVLTPKERKDFEEFFNSLSREERVALLGGEDFVNAYPKLATDVKEFFAETFASHAWTKRNQTLLNKLFGKIEGFIKYRLMILDGHAKTHVLARKYLENIHDKALKGRPNATSLNSPVLRFLAEHWTSPKATIHHRMEVLRRVREMGIGPSQWVDIIGNRIASKVLNNPKGYAAITSNAQVKEVAELIERTKKEFGYGPPTPTRGISAGSYESLIRGVVRQQFYETLEVMSKTMDKGSVEYKKFVEPFLTSMDKKHGWLGHELWLKDTTLTSDSLPKTVTNLISSVVDSRAYLQFGTESFPNLEFVTTANDLNLVEQMQGHFYEVGPVVSPDVKQQAGGSLIASRITILSRILPENLDEAIEVRHWNSLAGAMKNRSGILNPAVHLMSLLSGAGFESGIARLQSLENAPTIYSDMISVLADTSGISFNSLAGIPGSGFTAETVRTKWRISGAEAHAGLAKLTKQYVNIAGGRDRLNEVAKRITGSELGDDVSPTDAFFLMLKETMEKGERFDTADALGEIAEKGRQVAYAYYNDRMPRLIDAGILDPLSVRINQETGLNKYAPHVWSTSKLKQHQDEVLLLFVDDFKAQGMGHAEAEKAANEVFASLTIDRNTIGIEDLDGTIRSTSATVFQNDLFLGKTGARKIWLKNPTSFYKYMETDAAFSLMSYADQWGGHYGVNYAISNWKGVDLATWTAARAAGDTSVLLRMEDTRALREKFNRIKSLESDIRTAEETAFIEDKAVLTMVNGPRQMIQEFREFVLQPEVQRFKKEFKAKSRADATKLERDLAIAREVSDKMLDDILGRNALGTTEVALEVATTAARNLTYGAKLKNLLASMLTELGTGNVLKLTEGRKSVAQSAIQMAQLIRSATPEQLEMFRHIVEIGHAHSLAPHRIKDVSDGAGDVLSVLEAQLSDNALGKVLKGSSRGAALLAKMTFKLGPEQMDRFMRQGAGYLWEKEVIATLPRFLKVLDAIGDRDWRTIDGPEMNGILRKNGFPDPQYFYQLIEHGYDRDMAETLMKYVRNREDFGLAGKGQFFNLRALQDDIAANTPSIRSHTDPTLATALGAEEGRRLLRIYDKYTGSMARKTAEAIVSPGVADRTQLFSNRFASKMWATLRQWSLAFMTKTVTNQLGKGDREILEWFTGLLFWSTVSTLVWRGTRGEIDEEFVNNLGTPGGVGRLMSDSFFRSGVTSGWFGDMLNSFYFRGDAEFTLKAAPLETGHQFLDTSWNFMKAIFQAPVTDGDSLNPTTSEGFDKWMDLSQFVPVANTVWIQSLLENLREPVVE